ncbi:hypothetical protein, partial [Corynebacterium tuscaniense]|uniref:hypothetical protein n=1 Tax=Corynebacterium tuscaniense TaxID=302449 RepID=UPI003619B6A5
MINLVPQDVLKASTLLDKAAQELMGHNFAHLAGQTTLFSQVSGLDQAGRMHQVISSVSQPEATRGLALFLSNAAGLLRDQV